MNYLSTRGGDAGLSFQDTVLTGLARDGGLLLPETIPDVSDRLGELAKLDYQSLAFEIIRLFATDHLEDYSSQRYEIGYSSAIAVVLFAIMIAANSVVKKMLSKVGN